MNKYRISRILDDYFECVCLTCKGVFASVEGPYNYCPLCGIKFDGIFDKVNPRYREPYQTSRGRDYEVQDGQIVFSYVPWLMVQTRQRINGSWSPWHLYVHGAMGERGSWGSMSVSIFKSYNNIDLVHYIWTCSSEVEKRLVLLDGDCLRVIKQSSFARS